MEVTRLVAQLTHNDFSPGSAPLEILPRLVKPVSDDPATRQVTTEDIEHWRTHPMEATRKNFIVDDPLREVLFVSDEGFKQFGGHSYDVQCENGDEEKISIGLTSLLEMVTGA